MSLQLRILLILIFHLSHFFAFTQKIQSIDFLEVKQDVKEKFGSYSFSEKVINQFKIDNPIEGTNRAKSTPSEIEFQLQLSEKNGTKYIKCYTEDKRINKIKVTFAVDTKERFYGCGEQFSHLLLNGKRIPVVTEEQGIGRGDMPISKFTKVLGIMGSKETSYFPLPYFISSALYSLALSGSSCHFPAVFDFSQSGFVTVEIDHRYASFDIIKSSSYEELFKKSFTDREQKFSQRPNWTHGTILGLQGGAAKVEAILDSCIRIGNPVTAIWIQDWCGRRKTRLGSQLKWEWKPDTLLYPDFKNWVSKLNGRGIKVMGYVHPFLALNTPMFEEAKTKGFLVTNPEGGIHIVKTGGFDAVLVNIINVDAQNWLQGIIEKNLIGNGLSGWMADFGEWCPWFVEDSIYNSFKPYNQASTESDYIRYNAHNRYVVKWAEINDMALSNHSEKELFFFMRAGNSFSNQYCPMFWMGDQMVDWGENDGLKSTVTALNSAAMSGIRNLHSDIGGYTTVKNGFVQVARDRELFFRWAELNIFQPFYRTHEGVMPEANHQFYSDDSTMHFFARMGKIHFALKPYRQQYEERLSPVPMIHPLLIDFPDDSVCYDLKYQFMYGKELMVAPVLDKGASNVNAYLPKGNWIELFSGKEYKGSFWHIVPAPFGKPPVFIRADSGWRTYFEDLFSGYK